jgi:hypothetical protein
VSNGCNVTAGELEEAAGILACLAQSIEGELSRLTSVEDQHELLPFKHGPIEGLAVLRRRVHGDEVGMLEVVDPSAYGYILASNDGYAAWGVQGLETVSDRNLEQMSRRALELLRAVVREQVRRVAQ